ncbi:MAG: hypothetical protein JXN60_09600 [Lentisphaerae bacterium]|nr:hypothetical protein [Lentisphaerota bacterium]
MTDREDKPDAGDAGEEGTHPASEPATKNAEFTPEERQMLAEAHKKFDEMDKFLRVMDAVLPSKQEIKPKPPEQ